MLFQNCVAYQNTAIPINEAQNRGKTKIVNNIGTKYMFNNIEFVDGAYYGYNGNETLLIDTSTISAIYLKDLKKSTRQSIILGVCIGVGVLILGALLSIAVASATEEMFNTLALILSGGI